METTKKTLSPKKQKSMFSKSPDRKRQMPPVRLPKEKEVVK